MGGRLIDTDELIELIDDDIAAHKDGYFEDFELPPSAYGSLCALRMVREYIKALPTVEPKHGRWMPVANGRGGFECSICNNYAPSYKNGDEWLSDYCPNCGAKMDDGEDG